MMTSDRDKLTLVKNVLEWLGDVMTQTSDNKMTIELRRRIEGLCEVVDGMLEGKF